MSIPAPAAAVAVAAAVAAPDTLRRADSIGDAESVSVRSTTNMLAFPPPRAVKAILRRQPSETDRAVSQEVANLLQRLALEQPDKVYFFRDLALTFLRPLPLLMLVVKSTCLAS